MTRKRILLAGASTSLLLTAIGWAMDQYEYRRPVDRSGASFSATLGEKTDEVCGVLAQPMIITAVLVLLITVLGAASKNGSR